MKDTRRHLWRAGAGGGSALSAPSAFSAVYPFLLEQPTPLRPCGDDAMEKLFTAEDAEDAEKSPLRALRVFVVHLFFLRP
jgi:hypothetical protein